MTMSQKNIGNLYKEKLQNWQTPPPDGVWQSIQQDTTLQKFNRRAQQRHFFHHIAIPTAIILVGTIFLVAFLYNHFSPIESQEKPTVTTAQLSDTTLTIDKESLINTRDSNSIPHSLLSQTIVPTKPTSTDKNSIADISTTPHEIAMPPVQKIQIDALSSHNTSPSITDLNTNLKNDLIQNHILSVSEDAKTGRTDAVTLRYNGDTTVCRNSKVVLYVENALQVHWSIGITSSSVTIYPEDEMFLYATVTREDKVDTTLYFHVRVYDCQLFIPSAFTPNGDGLNDEFIIHAPTDISNYECIICDKTGMILFHSNNVHQGWNGMVNGKLLPLDSYFYVITYRDALGNKHSQKGQVLLIR